MKLNKVLYELYESDHSCIKGHENSEVHEIDREICLEFDEGNRIYVSWTDAPIQFSVDYKESQWNMNNPDIVVDASSWKMWKPLIGKSCEFIFHGEEHQVLELKCSDKSIYFSSQDKGSWFSDVLHISASKPLYNS